MSYVETDIFSALNTANIKAYPVEAPQGTSGSYVVYRRISTQRNDTIGGKGTIERARFQFNCYAANYAASKALAGAVNTAIGVKFGSKAIHQHEADETEDGENWVWVDYIIWTKQGA